MEFPRLRYDYANDNAVGARRRHNDSLRLCREEGKGGLGVGKTLSGRVFYDESASSATTSATSPGGGGTAPEQGPTTGARPTYDPDLH